MEELSPKIVPLGSLAIVFAGVYILMFIRKTLLSREAEKSRGIRMSDKRNKKNESLSEQKRRLELLIKK